MRITGIKRIMNGSGTATAELTVTVSIDELEILDRIHAAYQEIELQHRKLRDIDIPADAVVKSTRSFRKMLPHIKD